jgi:dienelactone hydrolase
MVTPRDVSYTADGRTMVGRLAVPDGPGPHAAVLLAHEGAGLDDVQRARADEYAALGYAAFALDYIGGGQPVADREWMYAYLAELHADPDRIHGLGAAGLDVLLDAGGDPGRVAAVGYCFGGSVALEMARAGDDLAAVAGLHPRLATTRPEGARRVRGRVLVCVGADDPLIPAAERLAFEEEMRAAGVDWRMHLYGGVQHSFTHPDATAAGIPGLAYDSSAAAHAHAAVLDLLRDTIG